MGFLCEECGLLHTPANEPGALWTHLPICHAGGVDWISGLGAGVSMGLAMMLMSLAPLRWTGVLSIAGGLTAALWVIGAGILHEMILASDQIASAGAFMSPAIPRFTILALGVAAALAESGRSRGPVWNPPFRDGVGCFLRCGPMMIAMMLTGTMSIAWMMAGALLSQIDQTIGDRRLSRFLIMGIGVSAAIFIAATP